MHGVLAMVIGLHTIPEYVRERGGHVRMVECMDYQQPLENIVILSRKTRLVQRGLIERRSVSEGYA